ncbi:hypothetical protein TWF481_008192 [Arthrobotrys musiformis]|uniref:Nuclear fusion protein KAR5 n=1 Tax=Arthrobotrys musiformis TaxID=47236 RepID=A0AAV9W8A6_9PEZI
MITMVNLATLLWVLWIIGSFPRMAEASTIVSPMNMENDAINAAIHPLESLISSHKRSKGYEDSLALINSLNLPHSCLYSSLTESIIAKCSTSPTVLDGEEKNFFATKLAICELSSANIDYPRDCRGNIQSSKDLNRCIKKLESRPQWWTSWSNCIQSVGVICQAVREEAERDTTTENILRLYRNITVLHHQLENQIVSSINLQTSSIEKSSQASKMAHQKVLTLIKDMDALIKHTLLMHECLTEFKTAMAKVNRVQLARETELVRQKVALDEQSHTQEKALLRISTTISRIFETLDGYDDVLAAKKIADEIKRHEAFQQMALAVRTTTDETVKAIKSSMEALHELSADAATKANTVLLRIVQHGKVVDRTADKFNSLANTHEKISQSMLIQEESAARQLENVAHHATLFNNTFLNAIAESTGYLEKLAEYRNGHLNAMGALPGFAWVSTYLPVLVSILVVLDRKRSAIAIIFFSAVYIFCLTHPFESTSGPDGSEGDGMGAGGLLIDAGNNQYRWLHACTTKIMGYIRFFW